MTVRSLLLLLCTLIVFLGDAAVPSHWAKDQHAVQKPIRAELVLTQLRSAGTSAMTGARWVNAYSEHSPLPCAGQAVPSANPVSLHILLTT